MASSASIAALMLLFASAAVAQSRSWDDLRVTFPLSGVATDGYVRLPRTLAAAAAQGWTSPPEEPAARCGGADPGVCALFDDATGNVTGVQLAFLRTDVAGPYPMAMHPTYQEAVRFGRDVYVATVFTVKPASAAASKQETGDGVWLAFGPRGEVNFEVPRLPAGMADTAFTLQSCVPGMGTHYYYNISRSLPCEEFEPIFALYDGGEMVGVGLQTWGTPTQLGARAWFEPVPAAAIRPTVPECPQCMVDWTAAYNLISLHIYFVDAPWTIAC